MSIGRIAIAAIFVFVACGGPVDRPAYAFDARRADPIRETMDKVEACATHPHICQSASDRPIGSPPARFAQGGACPRGYHLCSSGGCCRAGMHCVSGGCCEVAGSTYCGEGQGCCPPGSHCASGGCCEVAGSSYCGANHCCPPGTKCGPDKTCVAAQPAPLYRQRPNLTVSPPPPPPPPEWRRPDTADLRECIGKLPSFPNVEPGGSGSSPACNAAQIRLYQSLQTKLNAPHEEGSLRIYMWQQLQQFYRAARLAPNRPGLGFTHPGQDCYMISRLRQEVENCNKQ